MDTQYFNAGAAKVDITPPMGTILGVDFVPHYARFIHDPVFVKALVLKDQNITIAIIVVDICIMGTDFIDSVKTEILWKTGIPPQNVLLAANHTHANGNVVGLLGSAVDIDYRNKLPKLIVRSVELAKLKLRPAKTTFGFTDVPGFVCCRRYFMQPGYEAKNPVTGGFDKVKTNPISAAHLIDRTAGITDPQLSFLAISDLDDKMISVLGNYSLHYVGDWHDDSVTGDYFGQFSSKLGELLNAGDDFVGIMSNGTSGDINIWDFLNPDRFPKGEFEKSKLIGNTLAQKVSEQISDCEWNENPRLGVRFEKPEFEIRKPSKPELEAAKKAILKYDFDNLSLKEDMVQRIYDREQVLLNEYPETYSLPLQTIMIGDLVIGALPGEFFAETGLLLKSAIGNKKYFSISLANAYGGYIPPLHEHEKGGYETWRARSSFMETGAEEKIRLKMIGLIKKITA